ncbi:MAG: CoA-binding protein [Phycisphaerae bacterium]|nr:CoA-binding protein [Phycisphaerae bacterium]
MSESTKRTVAVVGASTDRRKFGNKAVRAYLKQGWQVYPVSVKAGEIEGLRTVRSVREVPPPVHRVSMYVPPAVGMSVIEEIAAVGPEEVFLNPGSESEELVAKARSLGLDPILACSILAIGEEPD